MKNNRIIDPITSQFLEVQNGKLWMGDTFKKKINSITEEEAFTRPLPTLHSVAELIAHLTAWKKDAILKIKNGKGRLTVDNGGNWPGNEELRQVGWDKLIKDFEESQSDIISLLQDKDDSFLQEQYVDQDFNGKFNYSFAIEGILHHDLYHLGQMGIVIKLIKEKTNT